jgi:hypothetical protein
MLCQGSGLHCKCQDARHILASLVLARSRHGNSPFVGGAASCRSKCRARGWCRSILPGCCCRCLCRERARIETSRLGLGDVQAHELSSGDMPTQVSSAHGTTSHSCVETGLTLVLKGIQSVEETHAAIDAHDQRPSLHSNHVACSQPRESEHARGSN